ncbi:hypothetical protein P4I32_22690, partial [Escherichia coli]
KSAQIREILISESAWEEMTCLFAPSLRRIASYLTKESQKKGGLIWGCNEVPAPARQGRPRNPK